MNAIEIIHRVEAHGGSLRLEGNDLKVRAPEPLPDDLMEDLRSSKAEVMIALGAPFDETIERILADLRPHLAPALQVLPDDNLLALINWNIIAAWNAAARELGQPTGRSRRAR